MSFPGVNRAVSLLSLGFVVLLLIDSGCLESGSPNSHRMRDTQPADTEIYAVNITYLDDTSTDGQTWTVNVCSPTDYGVLLLKNEGSSSDTFKIAVLNVTAGFKVGLDRDTVTSDNTTVEPIILTYQVTDAKVGDTGYATISAASTTHPNSTDSLVLELQFTHAGETVTKKGDKVMVSYVLTDVNGTQLDSGTLPATAGEQYVGPAQKLGYIEGFYLGLLGMYRNEVKSIRVPPELAYGTDPNANDLGGQTLIFRLTLDAMIPM